MTGWIFLAVFLAVVAVLTGLILVIVGKVRRFSRRNFGTPDLFRALESVETTADESPRSLNGCDTLLLPKILADFPDFDVTLAKTRVRTAMLSHLSGKSEPIVHRIVIARYLPTAISKTIVFQAAVSHLEDGRRRQLRYNIHDTYAMPGSTESVAANCPNCGGALGYGQTVCPYCGSRVANALGSVWHITQISPS